MGLKGAIRRAYERRQVASITRKAKRQQERMEYQREYDREYRTQRAKAIRTKARMDARRQAAGGSAGNWGNRVRKGVAVADAIFGYNQKTGRKKTSMNFDPWTGFSKPKPKKKRKRKGKTIMLRLS